MFCVDKCLLLFILNWFITIYILAPTGTPAAEVEVCMTFLHFSVTHNMAPLGRLLVYYVRENGEGVTDSLQFPVKSSFENQVSVT